MVARLVRFIHKENKTQVNHKGEKPNKADNRVWMIEWNTPKENTNHAIENGLRNPPKHEKHPNAKLNWEIVSLIRRYFLIHPSGDIKKICDKFSIKKRTVYSVVYNEIWVDENLQKIKIDTSKKYTLSDLQISEIRKIGDSISSIVLGKRYGVSSSTILAIRNKTGSYKNK